MEKKDFRVYNKNSAVLFNSRSKTGTEVLSNFHSCDLKVSEIVFNSVEQLFAALTFSNYPEWQQAIMECNSAQEVKKVAKRLKNKMRGTLPKKRIFKQLLFCLRVKYVQCIDFKRLIDSTGEKPLVEYTTWGDKFYGASPVESWLKNNWNEGTCEGRNACGRLMMLVREEGKNGLLNEMLRSMNMSEFKLLGKSVWVEV